MPWTPADAQRHDRKAGSPKAQRQWSDVANSVLQKTGDEARAVRTANGVIKRRSPVAETFARHAPNERS